MRRVLMVTMLTLALALCVTAASADPWPNLGAATPVSYFTVVPVFDAGTLTYTYQVSVDAAAPAYIFEFAVYQPGGSPLIPVTISGFSGGTSTRSGWDVPTFGGNPWESSKHAFGWSGKPPSTNPINPGGSDNTSFYASWSGSAPAADAFTYVAHVMGTEGEGCGQTFWVQCGGPPVIPEPASIVLLGLGGLGLLGLRRRKS